MQRTIEFRHDQANDIVIATPHWKIETEADVREWFEQYVAYMRGFSRKMDMVFLLDHFDVKPAIGSVWGDYRARLHQQFTRFHYRVHSARSVRLFVSTSGVRYNVDTQEAASIDDAIQGILAARRAATAR